MNKLKNANKLFRENKFTQALDIYLELKKNSTIGDFLNVNINICKSRLNKPCYISIPDKSIQDKRNFESNTVVNLGEAFKQLGIEQIYVLNLKRRPDRKIKIIKEFNLNGLYPKFIDAIDGKVSIEATEKYEQFLARPVGLCKSSMHVPLEKQKMHKQILNPGVFAYLLSQKIIIEDAIENQYKKICVFDDDVFFTDFAANQIKQLAQNLEDDWKIIMLGASEYTDALDLTNQSTYTPIAGQTCGSFGVLYQYNIFSDILEAVNEYAGTYDNVVLGYLYSKYPQNCHVVNPNICIPDVTSSDIRNGTRDQNNQAKRMRWDISNLVRWNTPTTLSVIFSSKQSLQYITQFNKKNSSDLSVIFYYQSIDGIRPITPGFSYVVDEQIDDIYNSINRCSEKEARDEIKQLGIPFSDYVILWPYNEVAITVLMLQTIVLEACSIDNTMLNDSIYGSKILKKCGKQPVKNLHSIIIPSFRDPSAIMPSLISALTQENVNYEVILVSDNPDLLDFNSIVMQEITAAQQKKLVPEGVVLKVIQHEKRRFASGARNTGLFAAQGEFISFLDDDDIYHQHRLNCVEGVLAQSSSEIGACYCGYSGVWNGQYQEERFRHGNLQFDILALNYASHYMNTDSVTYKHYALSRIGGFNESYIRHQDIELNLRFFDCYDIISVKEICVNVRPTVVMSTFNDNYEALIELKVKLLNDFSYILETLKIEQINVVISNHARDILKRVKNKSEQCDLLVVTFLTKCLKFNFNAVSDKGLRVTESEKNRSKTAIENIKKGHEFLKTADYENARIQYEIAVIDKPFEGCMALVWLYKIMGNYNLAETYVLKALSYNNKYMKAYLALAKIQEKLGKVDDLGITVQKMFELDPRSMDLIKFIERSNIKHLHMK